MHSAVPSPLRCALLHALPVLAALALFPAPAPAQEPGRIGTVQRNYLSIDAFAGRPAGEFRQTLGDGYGMGFRSLRRLNRDGWLALRIEGGFLLQDMRSDPVPSARDLRLSTSNTMLFAGVGPQVGLPRGPVQPYAHAFAGVNYLVTEAAFNGPGGEILITHEDNAWALGGGAGLYVPVRRGRSPVSLDLGATWRLGGKATLMKQTLVPGTDGMPAHQPITGRTDLLMVHLGLAFAFGS
jgi:hypothetical protein